MNGIGRRVAIVEGCRTPFAKANTAFRELSAVDLVIREGRIYGRDIPERAYGQTQQQPSGAIA